MLSRQPLRAAVLTAAFLMVALGAACGGAPAETSEPPAGGLTREEAIAILLDEVIRPDSLDSGILALALDNPLPAGSEVAPFAPVDLPDEVTEVPFLVPTTLERETWFFWVDDDPFAQFAHPTRYVFIDAETGAVTVQAEEWWPFVDGEPVTQWIDDEERWDPANQAFTNAPDEEIPGSGALRTASLSGPHLLASTTGRGTARRAADAPPGEAIVAINGWKAGGRHGRDAGFTDDMANARDFSRRSGIPLYEPEGETLQDIEAAIQKAVDGGAVDVFFYFTGHGSRTRDGKPWRPFKDIAMRPADLEAILKKFSPPVRFKVGVQGCYSGGWIKPLQDSGVVDIVITSSAADEVSYGDWDPPERLDPNRDDTGSEYSSGFWEDLNEVNESEAQQAQAREVAAGHNRSEFVGWLILADVSATAKDATANAGRTSPTTWINDEAPRVEDVHEAIRLSLVNAGANVVWLPEYTDVGSIRPNGQFFSTTLPEDHPLLDSFSLFLGDSEGGLYLIHIGETENLSINFSIFLPGDSQFSPSTSLTLDTGAPDNPVAPGFEAKTTIDETAVRTCREDNVVGLQVATQGAASEFNRTSEWKYLGRPDGNFDLVHRVVGPDNLAPLAALLGLGPTEDPTDFNPSALMPVFRDTWNPESQLPLLRLLDVDELTRFGACLRVLLQ